jgi:hypothetical protein
VGLEISRHGGKGDNGGCGTVGNGNGRGAEVSGLFGQSLGTLLVKVTEYTTIGVLSTCHLFVEDLEALGGGQVHQHRPVVATV